MKLKAKETIPVEDEALETEKLTKAMVISRLADWKKRLEKLFDEIESWRRSYAPEYQPQRFSIDQMHEELMKKFKIAPEKLPAYTLIKGKERIAFVPSNLWIIGAKGRVNITTNETQYNLVDMREGEDKPSDWEIVSKDYRKVLVPFNAESFNQIIGRKTV